MIVYYDPELPINVAVAPLNYVKYPFPFASQKVTATEFNYFQIDKEVLALMFGINKLHKYLYGRHFTLVTHHKSLVFLLNPKKGISLLAAMRLQCRAL